MGGNPVLHMDFSKSKYMETDKLREVLKIEISRRENLRQGNDECSFSTRFEGYYGRN